MDSKTRPAKRVAIHVRAHAPADRGASRLAEAIVALLRREGAAGATVLRGIDGLRGPGERHSAPSATNPLADFPLVIEWVDDAERVKRLLPQVEAMLTEGTITVKDIEVV